MIGNPNNSRRLGLAQANRESREQDFRIKTYIAWRKADVKRRTSMDRFAVRITDQP